MNTVYLDATQESGRDFVMRRMQGEIVMLNLLRFREVADYAATPELAPSNPISGAEAFQRYIDHTLPYLRETGGDLGIVVQHMAQACRPLEMLALQRGRHVYGTVIVLHPPHPDAVELLQREPDGVAVAMAGGADAVGGMNHQPLAHR